MIYEAVWLDAGNFYCIIIVESTMSLVMAVVSMCHCVGNFGVLSKFCLVTEAIQRFVWAHWIELKYPINIFLNFIKMWKLYYFIWWHVQIYISAYQSFSSILPLFISICNRAQLNKHQLNSIASTSSFHSHCRTVRFHINAKIKSV